MWHRKVRSREPQLLEGHFQEEVECPRHAELDRRGNHKAHAKFSQRQGRKEDGNRAVQAGADLHGWPKGSHRDELELGGLGHHPTERCQLMGSWWALRSAMPPNDWESKTRVTNPRLGVDGHLPLVHSTLADLPTRSPRLYEPTSRYFLRQEFPRHRQVADTRAGFTLCNDRVP